MLVIDPSSKLLSIINKLHRRRSYSDKSCAKIERDKMTARELKKLLNGIEEKHLDREIITFNTGNTDRHNIVSVCEEPDFDDYEELFIYTI